MYSKIILNNSISTDDYLKLSDIYDRLVFLEAIKCSPKGNKSKPEKNMNYCCPNEFLISEINILNPKMILLFGNSVSNYFKIKKNLVNNINYSKNKKIELFKISVNNKIIDVVKIIHPTAFGGNNNTLYKELYNLLNVNL